MARYTVSLEKATEQLYEKHGSNIEFIEFCGASVESNFYCNVCGHNWWALTSKVTHQTGCPNCQRLNDKHSDDYIQIFIEERGCKWIYGKYENARSELFIEFECGHSDWIIYNSFQQGRRCSICGIKQRSDSHRTKESEIVLFLDEHGFTFIDFPNGFITQKKSSVRYSCSKGHITERQCGNLFQNPTCNECEFDDLRQLHTGKNNRWWKGGTTELRDFCANQIFEWKEESKINCNYKCVVTGKKMEEVHHIYPFGKIIFDALKNLNLPVEEKINNYSYEEMESISVEVRRLHSIYPLGVCLTKNVHKLFHKIYGRGDTTPEQWYDFVENIRSGKIQVQ
jgi:hypothetical protein